MVGAQWSEIDFGNALWTIPAGRMKAGSEHRVPLSPQAITLLRSLPREDGNPSVFINPQTRGKPLSTAAMMSLLKKRMNVPATVHGFRSAFSDWAHNTTTHFANHEIELSLAHSVGSAVERAYRRFDLLERRRELMNAWARFVATPKTEGAGTVADLAEARVRVQGRAIRRQAFWDSERLHLREALARLAGDVRRLADDAASVGLRWSAV